MQAKKSVLLKVEQLGFSRDQRCLIKNLNFQLQSGQLLHVQGKNGCGKSSLLQLLLGVLPPTSGRVTRYAQSLHYLGHQLAIKNGLTVAENLQFYRQMQAMDAENNSHDSLLQALQMQAKKHCLAAQLSAGQRQRLALARLIMTPAELWLLDEPLTAMDAQGVALLHRLLRQQIQQGGAVVMTSHQRLHFDEAEIPLTCLRLD